MWINDVRFRPMRLNELIDVVAKLQTPPEPMLRMDRHEFKRLQNEWEATYGPLIPSTSTEFRLMGIVVRVDP